MVFNFVEACSVVGKWIILSISIDSFSPFRTISYIMGALSEYDSRDELTEGKCDC